MKYFRVEDEIFKTSLFQKKCINGISYYENDYGLCFYTLKEADNIEELCDAFLVVRENETPIFLLYSDILCHKDRYSQPYDKKCEYYGAIWTNWGLKYVAKMNEQGKWELL